MNLRELSIHGLFPGQCEAEALICLKNLGYDRSQEPCDSPLYENWSVHCIGQTDEFGLKTELCSAQIRVDDRTVQQVSGDVLASSVAEIVRVGDSAEQVIQKLSLTQDVQFKGRQLIGLNAYSNRSFRTDVVFVCDDSRVNGIVLGRDLFFSSEEIARELNNPQLGVSRGPRLSEPVE